MSTLTRFFFQSDMIDDNSATKYGILSATPPTHRTTSSNQSSSSVVATGTTATTGLSFSNPVYELSNPTAGESTLDGFGPTATMQTPPSQSSADTVPNVAFKVEHVLGQDCDGGSRRLGDIRSGLESRWRVAQAIYPYMVCIALAYCVTLSLYPGIESEIISCNLKSWMPVLLMFTFNTSDVIGKVMASFPYTWSRRQLILLSTMRIALVPLLLLCCAPRSQPVIAGETPAFIFSAALGITNGLAGSLPMILAPAKVPATLKEVTGNMMTVSYNVGLTAGSLIGYVFDSMLGPPISSPCPSYPYIPRSPSMMNTTTATIATTVRATLATVRPALTTLAAQTTKIASTASTLATPTIASVVSTSIAAVTAVTTGALNATTDAVTSEATPGLATLATTIISTLVNSTDSNSNLPSH